MYSFIVNSINPENLARLQHNLQHVMRDALSEWELIHIPDAKSMCEGYNRGMSRANGEHLIFCHDDIKFLADDISLQLTYAFQHSDVFGILGSRVVCTANWMAACQPHTLGYIVQMSENQKYQLVLCGLEDTLMFGAQGLDGVLIGCHSRFAKQLQWDEKTFDGWHGYDVDFTYRAFLTGLNIAVVGCLPLVHYSSGTFASDDFKKYASIFSQKYPNIRNANGFIGKSSFHLILGEFETNDDSLVRWLTENFNDLIIRTGNLRAHCVVDAAKLLTQQGHINATKQ